MPEQISENEKTEAFGKALFLANLAVASLHKRELENAALALERAAIILRAVL